MSAPLIHLWFSGRDLSGGYKTDATWFHDATKVLHVTGHASRWARMRHWKRSAIRNGGLITAAATGWDLRYHLRDTLAILALLALLLAVHAVTRAVCAARLWRHNRHYVSPLHYALTPIMGVPPAALEVAPDRTAATLWLPEEFTAGEDGRARAAITQAVTAKLAIEAPEAKWQLEGRKPCVTFTKSEPPPAKVALRDIRAEIEASAEHEVVLGLGKKRKVIRKSIDSETPHLGLCMTTGDGKSVAAMNIGTQILYHGGLLVILDYKMLSHMWARDLPNVCYADTPEKIHEALIWLASDDYGQESELTYRKKVGRATADIRGNVHGDVGPRILVVAEELNATQKRLKAYWRRIGGKGPSPAAEAMDEIMFTGRQLRVHVLQIGQRLSARASGSDGSADARENLGLIVFSNPSASTWKMLTDGHTQPPASDHKGRYQVVSRKTVEEMQGALLDEQEARDLATAGTVALPHRDMPFTRHVVPVASHLAISAGDPGDPAGQPVVVGHTPIPPRPPNTATIREAIEAGIFGRVDLAAARKRVLRAGLADAGWEGSAKLYQITDLKELIR